MTYLIAVLDNDAEFIGYLSEVDFEANGPKYPTGMARADPDPGKAIRFDTAKDAIEFMHTQSKSCPNRPDGKPNRPLRALHLEVINAEESTGMGWKH